MRERSIQPSLVTSIFWASAMPSDVSRSPSTVPARENTILVPSGDHVGRLLDYLRDLQGLTGTKHACREGDCGACTVMVTDEGGARALNACILFLPQLHGRAVRTALRGRWGYVGDVR